MDEDKEAKLTIETRNLRNRGGKKEATPILYVELSEIEKAKALYSEIQKDFIGNLGFGFSIEEEKGVVNIYS